MSDANHPPFPIQFRDPRRYEIIGEHGRGGLGRVSRSHDRELGRDVAIKEMLSRGSANEARFLREALITARLEHPGIVPMYEAGRWPDGTPFYAMKLVSGRPLRELIAERTTIDQRIGLLHHVIAVGDAIAYAHARNIIHRDLKPANVIVGDFGETIVIDWGLAKDLSAVEESAGRGEPFPDAHDGALTGAGTVVGTPTYMAPEQERGEQVDQRADVFAIGAMLWELCSLQKVPPTNIRQRHRMLRRSGIDKDLIVILDKALDPTPERRYRDAGAFASDLKAFKSGARITARSYSLFAMLAHWTRRHRGLALSVAVAVALAVIGSLLYTHNVGVERDRADGALDELTLKHAELLLTTDPSAALDAVMSYRGANVGRADQIRAEAKGRGVAFVRAVPHTDTVMWTGAAPDGAIISLSSDGTIARTYFDGTSSVLTRGVSKIAMMAYSRVRYLLAYTCDPSDLCLFDIARGTRTPLAATLHGSSVNGASFSPDGTTLAVLSLDGMLWLLDVTDPTRPIVRLVKTVAGGKDVTFIDDSVLAVDIEVGILFVRVTGDSERILLPKISRWASSAREHQVAIANTNGSALVVEAFPARIVARIDLCHGPAGTLSFITGQFGIAFACREGTVGIWNPQRNTVRSLVRIEGHADHVTTSPAGDYILAIGGNGTVTVIDLSTGLLASYNGHGFPLVGLTAPTPDHPFVISGDLSGAVRAWPVPPRFARVAATSSAPFYTAIFDRESATVTATTWQPALTVFSPSTGLRLIEPHDVLNTSLERSTSGRTFATYGLQDLVEVWSPATMTRTRIITTGHGSVSQLSFVGNSEEFITAGHDGRLVRWTAGGDPILIAQHDQPIDKFALIPATDAIAFSTVDGGLWWTDSAGHTHSLGTRGSRINLLLASKHQQVVYAGYANGELVSIDTKSWRRETLVHGFGAIRDIAVTEDGHTIAVAANDGTIRVGTVHDGTSNPGSANWMTLRPRGRNIALAPDGLLLITSTDGTIWLYSLPKQRWECLPTGTTDLGKVVVTPDGKAAVALDRQGRLIWIDLDAARKVLGAAR